MQDRVDVELEDGEILGSNNDELDLSDDLSSTDDSGPADIPMVRDSRVDESVEIIHLLAVYFIRNLAAQALLFAYRDEPSDHHPSTRFQRMSGCLGKRADAVIDRRNRTLHYDSITDIEVDISKARSLLDRFPLIRKQHVQESAVIDSFSRLKASFKLE